MYIKHGLLQLTHSSLLCQVQEVGKFFLHKMLIDTKLSYVSQSVDQLVSPWVQSVDQFFLTRACIAVSDLKELINDKFQLARSVSQLVSQTVGQSYGIKGEN